MPPTTTITHETGVLDEEDLEQYFKIQPEILDKLKKPSEQVNYVLEWRSIIFFTIAHSFALYGLYAMFTAKLLTIAFGIFYFVLGTLGATAGVHRLWSHRSFKATWGLRLFLMICNSIAFQLSIYHWARDHRVHHKYSETDADPYNAKRGFFYSHIGWLLIKKRPEVIEKGKKIDLSDLHSDSIVMFQKRYYKYLMPSFCFVLPTFIPWYFWNETFMNSFCINMVRYLLNNHSIWCVNSVAHLWGNRPYDKNINPTDRFDISAFSLGEGWHNYHHVFPWDYKASELGRFNFTTAFIDFCARMGWAYDLKTVPEDVLIKRTLRSGDGSHPLWKPEDTNEILREKLSQCFS